MGSVNFEVYISGQSSSVEEWGKALHAADSELPKLTEAQLDVAKRMQIPPKEFARGVLAGQLSEERLKQRGEQLGKKVDEFLMPLGSYYRLTAIIREGTEFRWVARILGPKGVKNVRIPLDLADDALDSNQSAVTSQLKALVMEGLGLSGEQETH